MSENQPLEVDEEGCLVVGVWYQQLIYLKRRFGKNTKLDQIALSTNISERNLRKYYALKVRPVEEHRRLIQDAAYRNNWHPEHIEKEENDYG